MGTLVEFKNNSIIKKNVPSLKVHMLEEFRI